MATHPPERLSDHDVVFAIIGIFTSSRALLTRAENMLVSVGTAAALKLGGYPRPSWRSCPAIRLRLGTQLAGASLASA